MKRIFRLIFLAVMIAALAVVLASCGNPDPGRSPLVSWTMPAGGGWLVTFFANAMLPLFAALVVIDVLFGVWASLREGIFDWKKVGDFYLRSVAPYFGAYMTLYIVYGIVPGVAETVAGGLSIAGLFAGIVAKLVGSILGNVARLGLSTNGQE